MTKGNLVIIKYAMKRPNKKIQISGFLNEQYGNKMQCEDFTKRN